MARYGWGGDQWLDNNGKPLSQGKLFFYDAGTVSAKVTYSDSAMTVPHTHPVGLDGAGRQPDIFFAGNAKIVITTSTGALVSAPTGPVTPITSMGLSNQTYYYDSVQSFVADANILIGDVVATLGYYAAGDGGHNLYKIVGGLAYTPDGGSIINLTNGLQAEAVFPDGVHLEQFGINAPDAAIASAVAYCTANNVRFLTIDHDVTITTVPVGFYNVIPIGNGTLSGAQRRWVYPQRAFNQTTGWIIPDLHLAQFKTTAASGTPKVVFFGDSLMTYLANSLGRQNSLASMLETKFVMEYPDVDIDFVNRAIGGQSWADALRPASVTTASWYVDPLKDWIDYVEDEVPDVVIVGLGMNQSGVEPFTPTFLSDFIDHLETWSPVPDIIFCTNLVPTLEGVAPWTGFNSVGSQESRDNCAGSLRTLCINRNYGFIDTNRVNNIVRDGFDIFDTYLERIVTDLDVTADSGAYTSDAEMRGYKFAATIEGTAAEIADVFDGTDGVLGASTGNTAVGPNLVFIRDLGTGVFTIQFFNESNFKYHEITTTTAIPTSSFTLYLEVRGNLFLMRIAENGNTNDIVRYNDLWVTGGFFSPRFGYHTDGYNSGPFTEITLDAAQPQLYLPTLTNDEIWAVGEAANTTKLPFGGNGINHPTSVGTSVIYGKAINDVRLR